MGIFSRLAQLINLPTLNIAIPILLRNTF